MSYTELVDVDVTQQEILDCSFSSWYSKFKHCTPKAKIIKPLSSQFIQYLSQDGIQLDLENDGNSYYHSAAENNEDNEYSDWENDSDTTEGSMEEIRPLKDFPELHQEIRAIISEFGSVTPKLNWSSPKDAVWILPNNSTKCNEVNDVYLLLNASNYIVHDLDHAFDECAGVVDNDVKFELVLRQWFDINPALEFRVFVRDSKVFGISQRDLNFYDYLKPLKGTCARLINDFINNTVVPNFPHDKFVADIYIPRPFKKCWLIDINPWARTTDALLFSWNELVTKKFDEKDIPDFRLITEHNMGRFVSKEHSENQVPKDVVQASLDPNSMRELTQKWTEILKMQEESDSD